MHIDLRSFNRWLDETIIELSVIFLMLGFMMGTVDVLTGGGISHAPVISYVWAVVQAVAIDGLFFAIWGRIARAPWSWRTLFKNIALIIVGLLLALIAALINDIIGYAQVARIADVSQVMTSVGIDQAHFTLLRSFLVVLVAVFVAIFARGDSDTMRAIIEELEGLKAINAIAPSTVEGLWFVKDNLEKMIQGLWATVEGLEKTIAGLRATNGKDEATITRLQNENAGLSSQLHELRATVESGLKTLENTRVALDTAVNERDNSRATIAGLEDEIAGLRATVEGLQKRTTRAMVARATREKARATEDDSPADSSPVAPAIAPQIVARSPEVNSPVAPAIVAHSPAVIARSPERVASGDSPVSPQVGARERVRAIILEARERGHKATNAEIQDATGLGYSTVKGHAREIYKELEAMPVLTLVSVGTADTADNEEEVRDTGELVAQ
jgi:hypothetical protein